MFENIKQNKIIKEYFNKETKNFWTIILSFTLILGLSYSTYLYFTSDGTKKNVQQDRDIPVNLNNQDSQNINSMVKNFIKDDSTWGLKLNKVNNNNLPDIQARLSTQSILFSDDVFTPRDVQYKKLRDKYIQPYSSIYYNDDTIANNWDRDAYSITNMAGFTVNNIVVNKVTSGVYVNGDRNNLAVTVPVSFVNQITNIQPTGSDELWDGTFYLNEKKYTNTGRITLIKVNGAWKVQNATGFAFNYPLVTFSSYDDGNYYGHLNDNKQKKIKLFVTKLGIHPTFS